MALLHRSWIQLKPKEGQEGVRSLEGPLKVEQGEAQRVYTYHPGTTSKVMPDPLLHCIRASDIRSYLTHSALRCPSFE
jgi:hypothetical protein